MRESCTSGSVRGARGNSRPYRNRREFIAQAETGRRPWLVESQKMPPAGLLATAWELDRWSSLTSLK